MFQFISKIGGIENLFLILSLLLFFFFISSLLKNRVLRFLLSFLGALFILGQTFSLYSTQTFIGYQFYLHANLSGITGFENLFLIQGSIFIAFTLLFCYLFFKSRTLLYKWGDSFKNNYLKFSLGLLFLGIVMVQGKFIENTKSLFSILQAKNNIEFEKVLEKYEMSDYITPKDIECSSGENIIIISMESLEKGFLSEKYAASTPNLNALKDKWFYQNMNQNKGSSWTSGSLYTYLTGFPAFFGAYGNSIFQSVQTSNISSITHVLKKAGYKSTYICSNTEHGGTKKLLKLFNVDSVIDYRSFPETGNESKFGLRDKEVFDYAKKEINTFSKSEEPFALFISTTDSHFPNGIYDKRMEEVISPKSSDFEFTVASLDYLIGDFIAYLESQNMLDNTTIYLFPDHLKMGDPTLLDDTGNRGLYVISNKKNKYLNNENLYQVDLAELILHGANIDHNLTFFNNYIKGDKGGYIDDNILQITEINTNGIINTEIKSINLNEISKNYNNYKIDNKRFIAESGGLIDDEYYSNTKEALDANYKNGFRLFELDILKTLDDEFVAFKSWDRWKAKTDYKGETPVNKVDFLNHKIAKKYTPLDMSEINNWFLNHKDAILITDATNEIESFSKQFIDKKRLMMQLSDIESLEKGIRHNILSAIADVKLVKDIPDDELKELSIAGLKYVTLSRRDIFKYEKLILKLNKLNILILAYDISLDEGFDEEYMVKYEMDKIFGIFANEWGFIPKTH